MSNPLLASMTTCERSAALVLTVSLAIASGLFAWVTVPANTTAKQSLFMFLSLKSVGARKTGSAYKQPSPPWRVPVFASTSFCSYCHILNMWYRHCFVAMAFVWPINVIVWCLFLHFVDLSSLLLLHLTQDPKYNFCLGRRCRPLQNPSSPKPC